MTIIYSVPVAIDQQFWIASIELFLKKEKESYINIYLGLIFY